MQSSDDFSNGFHGDHHRELECEEKQFGGLSSFGRAKRRSRGGARDLKDGGANVLRVSDQLGEQKSLETSESSPPPCTDFDVAYFHSYAHVGIHEEMIKVLSFFFFFFFLPLLLLIVLLVWELKLRFRFEFFFGLGIIGLSTQFSNLLQLMFLKNQILGMYRSSRSRTKIGFFSLKFLFAQKENVNVCKILAENLFWYINLGCFVSLPF